jgi:hypothetical protein
MKTTEEKIIADARTAEQDAADFLRREDSAIQKQWTDRNFVTKTRENARVQDPSEALDARIESAILQEREHMVEAIGQALGQMLGPIQKRLRKLERARREK